MTGASSQGISVTKGLDHGPPKPTTFTSTALNVLYPAPCPLSINHLTTQDIALYTTVLSHRPPLEKGTNSTEYREYIRRTSAVISSLDAHLLNPTKGPLRHLSQSHLVAMFHRAGANDALPHAADLCNLHNRLNAQVIADTLDVIEMEVEDFLPDILATIEVINGHDILACVSDQLVSCLQAAEDFCASFLIPQEFSFWYQRAPPDKWQCSPSDEAGCDACTLARVAADRDLLLALRAIMLARMPSEVLSLQVRCPRLEWIGSWIQSWGVEAAEMLMTSGRMGQELRNLLVQKSHHAPSNSACSGMTGFTSLTRHSDTTLSLSSWSREEPASTKVADFTSPMASSTLLRASQTPELPKKRPSFSFLQRIPGTMWKRGSKYFNENDATHISPSISLPLELFQFADAVHSLPTEISHPKCRASAVGEIGWASMD